MVKWIKYCIGILILSTLTYASANPLSTNEIEQIILMLEWWDTIGSSLASLENAPSPLPLATTDVYFLSSPTWLDPVETQP